MNSCDRSRRRRSSKAKLFDVVGRRSWVPTVGVQTRNPFSARRYHLSTTGRGTELSSAEIKNPCACVQSLRETHWLEGKTGCLWLFQASFFFPFSDAGWKSFASKLTGQWVKTWRSWTEVLHYGATAFRDEQQCSWSLPLHRLVPDEHRLKWCSPAQCDYTQTLHVWHSCLHQGSM